MIGNPEPIEGGGWARPLGSDIWVYEGVASLDLCDRLIKAYDDLDEERIGWRHTSEGTKGSSVVVGSKAAAGDLLWCELDNLLFSVFTRVLGSHYRRYGLVGRVSDEGFGICCYEPGDKMELHVDGPLGPEGQTRAWGVVLYLNDCPDAPVVFPNQGIEIVPVKGLLAAWPAHFTHPHFTKPSKQRRMIVVTWSRPYAQP